MKHLSQYILLFLILICGTSHAQTVRISLHANATPRAHYAAEYLQKKLTTLGCQLTDKKRCNYQIILTRGDNHLDETEIQVEMDEETFSDETKDLESLKNKIYNSVKSKLGIYAKIKLVEPRTIARSEGKAKRVIDNRVI